MRPGFYVCNSPDSMLLQRTVETVIRENVATDAPQKRMVFRGDEDEGLTDDFWNALTLQGFETTLRIVVLRHAEKLPIALLRKLSEVLGRPNPQVFCILCLENSWEWNKTKRAWDKKVPQIMANLQCLTFAQKKQWWKEAPPLTPVTVKTFVQQLAKEFNLGFAPGASEAIVAALPADASAITTEMQKLALLARHRTEKQNGSTTTPEPRQESSQKQDPARKTDSSSAQLLPEDAQLIRNTEPFDLFAMIGHLQNGHIAEVWKLLGKESPEEVIFPLIANLRNYARESWQILTNDEQAVEVLKVRKVFGFRAPLANKLKLGGVIRWMDILHTAELSIKSGNATPAQALERLIADTALLLHSG